MEKIRKDYIDKLGLEISRIEKSISRDEDILKNLKNINLPSEIYLSKKHEISTGIDKKKEDIQSYKKRQGDYNLGLLDENIKEELVQNKIRITVNNKKKQQQPHKKPVKIFYKNNIQSEESLNRSMDISYYQFMKAVDTLPEYIKYNLHDMPNNKGYIWRGCWFFGKKREEYGEPLIMFEKARNGVMFIHEINDYEHKIYQKNGKEKKTLISCTRKKNIIS